MRLRTVCIQLLLVAALVAPKKYGATALVALGVNDETPTIS